MTASIPALLQPLKDRLAAATPGPWFREYGDVITTDPDPRDVEEGYDDPRSLRVVRAAPHLAKREPQAIKDATFIAAAPTDQAKLIAAIEAVESLASRTVNAPIEYSAGYLAQDILAALTQALGGG